MRSLLFIYFQLSGLTETVRLSLILLYTNLFHLYLHICKWETIILCQVILSLNHVLVSTIAWSIYIIEYYDFKCNKWLVCTLTKLWKESKEKCLYMHKISFIIHPTIFQFQVDAMYQFFLSKTCFTCTQTQNIHALVYEVMHMRWP